MLRALALIASVLLSLSLAACGGGSSSSQNASHGAPGAASIAAPYTFLASDYHTVVQQLYVAYFGRPADPGGLENFAAELSATDAPNDIQGFNAAYNRDARIRSLIDSFGVSAESNALYTGVTRAFVTAIYRNVLNRAPDPDGITFWVNAIDQGGLTRAHASFSIMAGALVNSTPQGRQDATLINRRITAATNFTAAVSSGTLVNTYRGNAAAAIARNMLATIVDTSDIAEIQSAIDATLPVLIANSGQQGQSPGNPPETFSAVVSVAPPEGAVIRTSERIELRGSGIRNAELLPAAGNLPIYARFNIADDNRSAWLDLDPQTLPNGPLSLRVVAWNAPAGGTGQETVAMTARTWTIQNTPPAPFTALLSRAPFDGSSLAGVYELEVHGSGLGNVELLPENGYTPVLGRFAVSPDKTTARLTFDTRIVPNLLLRVRIVAFDVAPGNIGAREIVVMPARSWWLQNSPPPVGTAEGRAARCLSSGRQHTRLSDPYPVVCIYQDAAVPYEQCKDGWGMLYANPEDGLPVLRDGRRISKMYCEPGAYNGVVNLGCSCN